VTRSRRFQVRYHDIKIAPGYVRDDEHGVIVDQFKVDRAEIRGITDHYGQHHCRIALNLRGSNAHLARPGVRHAKCQRDRQQTQERIP